MHSKLRPATCEDAFFLSRRLRREDIQELCVSSGIGPLEALLQGMEASSPHAWVLEEAETHEPYLMGGTRNMGGGIGIVWLLASEDILRHALTVQKEATHMIRQIFQHGEYRAVGNVVSAANHRTIAWLKRLGFSLVHKNVPLGHQGELFHSFAMAAPESYGGSAHV